MAGICEHIQGAAKSLMAARTQIEDGDTDGGEEHLELAIEDAKAALRKLREGE